MKPDKLLAFLAIAISCAAIAISLVALSRDPLGTDLSKYDFSSPENTLRSINSMVAKQDLRAAWQMLKGALQSDSSPDMRLFLADKPTISVIKSIEVSDSGNPKNNGVIVSFVKLTVSGVDYYTVQYFKKDQANRFNLTSDFSLLYVTAKSDKDKALESAIEEFKKTGKT